MWSIGNQKGGQERLDLGSRGENIVNEFNDKVVIVTGGANGIGNGGMTRQMIYHNDFGWMLSE